MNAAEPIIVFGAGGHGRVVIEALRCAGGFSVVAVLDPHRGGDIDGVPVRGGDDVAEGLRQEGIGHAAVGVGSVGDPSVRRRLHELAVSLGFILPPIVHPGAIVAATARLDSGTFVAAGAVVGPGVRLGEGAIVNSNAVVDHECSVGAFAHIAPGAILSGNVTVGEAAHVGTGSAVMQGVSIGARAVVGAGAAVVADVPDEALALGVPARCESR
jgi:UDP-perosamine 4-acetyltransferase